MTLEVPIIAVRLIDSQPNMHLFTQAALTLLARPSVGKVLVYYFLITSINFQFQANVGL